MFHCGDRPRVTVDGGGGGTDCAVTPPAPASRDTRTSPTRSAPAPTRGGWVIWVGGTAAASTAWSRHGPWAIGPSTPTLPGPPGASRGRVVPATGGFIGLGSRDRRAVGTGHAATAHLSVDVALEGAHRPRRVRDPAVRILGSVTPRVVVVSPPRADRGERSVDGHQRTTGGIWRDSAARVRPRSSRITGPPPPMGHRRPRRGHPAVHRRPLVAARSGARHSPAASGGPRPGRTPTGILGPAAGLPLITIIAKIPQLQFTRFLGILLGVVLVMLLILPGGFALMAYNHAFRCKRRLFSSSSLPGVLTQRSEKNVYDIEDAFFALIGQPKRSERASERWAYGIVLAALIIFITRVLLTLPFDIITGFAIAWACYLIYAIYRTRRHRQR